MDTTQVIEQAEMSARQTAKGWSDKIKGTARDAGAAADLYVHEYAWTTVTLIAVCAAVAGFFLGRSKRKVP